MRIAASCGQPRQVISDPLGARICRLTAVDEMVRSEHPVGTDTGHLKAHQVAHRAGG
jgi:hypothetical protein